MSNATERRVYSIAGDEADFLAYDSKGLLPDELIVRAFTAVLNRGRGVAIALPLAPDECEQINSAIDIGKLRKEEPIQ